MIRHIYKILAWMTVLCAAMMLCSCSDWFCKDDEKKDSDHVLLLYSAGFNSLSSFLKGDFNDLKSGYVPGKEDGEDVLLVYMHQPESGGKYSVPTSPVLMRLFKDKNDKVVTDTLMVYEKGAISASAGQLGKVLGYIKDTFPAKGYGMIFSSHATGWLPAGYYSNSEKYENGEYTPVRKFSYPGTPVAVPYTAPDYDPSLPLTKSIGQDQVVTGQGRMSYELELADFAKAIPMHMDYILFDACLMGGVEVAYQLRNVCDKVGFSQAEVLAEGFDYTTLTRHLFLEAEPDPAKVCMDYFAYYDAKNGVEQSATVSVIDCKKIEPLAGVCKTLFAEYSESLDGLDPAKVQRFFRSNYHWFYDLESIMVEAGITDAQLQTLRSALNECVIYKAATHSFMGSFAIHTFSGFSMFLPCNGGERLKEFYKTLDWNQATGLVR